ncbi:MAG: tyrosine decarboxylase [Theionarchaea archaeon DG-70-1]|nr:MAG: tyrosine decarboxylase [Theionarchaea archaeon DG-70-1]
MKLNIKALFLGPKSENRTFFKEMLNFLMDEHMFWRRDFHPEDEPVISLSDRYKKEFGVTLEKTQKALLELSSKLKTTSMPWFSPRYLGHMNADTLIAANLGYMATILYNPNNVAYEGSPATTPLEIEVGTQLAQMMGYDPEKAWGHITADGTIANYEGLWVARNMKSVPLAIKKVDPDLVKGLDEWQLLNLPTGTILDLIETVIKKKELPEVLKYSARGRGAGRGNLGALLVPQSKHYSWPKGVDILGIGLENMVNIQVRDTYRMDIDELEKKIRELTEKKIPVLGVVAVVGTTEEGAVDEVHEIVKLRSELEEEGISFYLHVDAAYGGYTRAIFLDESSAYMDFDTLKQVLHDEGILHKDVDWPTKSVYASYKAMAEADSITIDPHKMGYCPYAAGGVVFKDNRVLNLISYFAAYIEEKGETLPMMLGSFIMEGSKPGASAAAVWMAHRVVPLTITGYGQLIGQSIEGTNRFYNSLCATDGFEVDKTKFMVAPLTKPDFNIVDFAFNEKGNKSLEKMNELNQTIYDHCSYKAGPVYADSFITSKTELSVDNYGNAPVTFITNLGIPPSEWDKIQSVYVLRSCVLTPYLTCHTTFEEYWDNFMNTMKKILKSIVD